MSNSKELKKIGAEWKALGEEVQQPLALPPTLTLAPTLYPTLYPRPQPWPYNPSPNP